MPDAFDTTQPDRDRDSARSAADLAEILAAALIEFKTKNQHPSPKPIKSIEVLTVLKTKRNGDEANP